MKNKDFSIYVHIPFCKRKCLYCDFCSSIPQNNDKRQYIDALKEEIKSKKQLFERRCAKTVYFGGGTPTVLTVLELKEILNEIKSNYNLREYAEITVECNPMSIKENYEYLKNLKEIGFNRLSIGIQSSDDMTLKTIGRGHTFAEAKETFQTARKIGFDNINVDLMFGLPNESDEILNKSIDDVLSLDAEHISIYSLQLEENTPLYLRKDKYSFPTDDTVADRYEMICQKLEKNSYIHYEISNFSKIGYESKHNSSYWDLTEYIGFGLSAHSYYNQTRFENTKNLDDYLDKIYLLTKNLIEEKESVEEYIMLSLRTAKGLNLNNFKEKFLFDIPQKYIEKLNRIDCEFINKSENNYSFTSKGFEVSNTLICDILDLDY